MRIDFSGEWLPVAGTQAKNMIIPITSIAYHEPLRPTELPSVAFVILSTHQHYWLDCRSESRRPSFRCLVDLAGINSPRGCGILLPRLSLDRRSLAVIPRNPCRRSLFFLA